MPCYFRRSAIAQALGSVSSYKSLHRNWEKSKTKGKEPTLTCKRYVPPCFYKGNTSDCESMLKTGNNTVKLKLFNGKIWDWYFLECRQQDVNYLKRKWTGVKASAPTLIKKGRNKYYLTFTFEENLYLKKNDSPLNKQRILAVDLGINTDACCSIIKSDGTILYRKFINFPSDKDRLFKVLGRIKKKQSKYGPKSVRKEWSYVNRLNTELLRKISKAIVSLAVEQDVNVIVFEYLDFRKKAKGAKKQRLHLWRKRGIQKLTEHQAHRNLIRVNRICAWNTSKLAFDGSGRVERHVALDTQDKKNYSFCKFSTGKVYNCDLNASYNIGARYFIREILKEKHYLAETIPNTVQRSLNHLLELNKAA